MTEATRLAVVAVGAADDGLGEQLWPRATIAINGRQHRAQVGVGERAVKGLSILPGS
jgi:hypothetical protein